MSRGAHRCSGASPPTSGQGLRFSQRPWAGFVFLDLLIVLIILGFLAAYIAPRYAHLDFSTHARMQTARTAVTEGYARLHLASIKYLVENGDMPEDLVDLRPDYLNATESLGDFTAVYVQGTGEITIEIYRGPASGQPLATRTFAWP